MSSPGRTQCKQGKAGLDPACQGLDSSQVQVRVGRPGLGLDDRQGPDYRQVQAQGLDYCQAQGRGAGVRSDPLLLALQALLELLEGPRIEVPAAAALRREELVIGLGRIDGSQDGFQAGTGNRRRWQAA